MLLTLYESIQHYCIIWRGWSPVVSTEVFWYLMFYKLKRCLPLRKLLHKKVLQDDCEGVRKKSCMTYHYHFHLGHKENTIFTISFLTISKPFLLFTYNSIQSSKEQFIAGLFFLGLYHTSQFHESNTPDSLWIFHQFNIASVSKKVFAILK